MLHWNPAAARRPLALMLLLAALAAAAPSHAGGGIFGIDHEWSRDDRGIWSRNVQQGLEYGVVVTELAGALWLGNDDQLGHTFWQTVDSSVVSGLLAEGLKRGFGRARPEQGRGPNAWFKGSCCESFPSGEVTLQASFVTPFIVDYARDHPWVWAMELLPAYDAVARLKSQAHWQSDVLAGWLIGTGVGYWAAKRQVPLSVQILPKGFSVGFEHRF